MERGSKKAAPSSPSHACVDTKETYYSLNDRFRDSVSFENCKFVHVEAKQERRFFLKWNCDIGYGLNRLNDSMGENRHSGLLTCCQKHARAEPPAQVRIFFAFGNELLACKNRLEIILEHSEKKVC